MTYNDILNCGAWSELIHLATVSPVLEEGRVDHGQLNFVIPYFWDWYTLIEQSERAVKYSNKAVSYFNFTELIVPDLISDGWFFKFYSVEVCPQADPYRGEPERAPH